MEAGRTRRQIVLGPKGKHMLREVCKEIGHILEKSDPEKYTGQCWRHSPNTAAAETGATLIDLHTHYD